MRCFATVLLALATTLANAQQLEILGSKFNVYLDSVDMTAAIRDCQYKIDDSKYPMGFKHRKFQNLRDDKFRTVIIPKTFTASDGKDYTITTIGRAAFAGYQNVEQIVIPSSVTAIEDYAFFRTSVSTMVIPTTVTQMGSRVFGYCPNLRHLTLPLGLEVRNDLYLESKSIDVKYQLDPTMTLGNKGPVGDSYASASDVDEDIPVTNIKQAETFAVIIANENYKKVAKVGCAINDGRAFRRYCERVLGIPIENIHYVEDGTLGAMTTEINWLMRVTKAYEGEASIIIYYAGHGIPNEKDRAGFLLPVDASGKDLSAAYSLENLYKTLGALNSQRVTLFLDACFSGSQRGEGMLMSARGVAIKARPEAPKGKMVVFSAAQGDETAWPYAEKGHGLFTYYLLKKLKETKGNVDYKTLADYIRKEVMRKSAVVNNKSQTPMVSHSLLLGDGWQTLKLLPNK